MVVFKVQTLIYKNLYVDLLQIVCHVFCAHHTLISSTYFEIINNMIILKCYVKKGAFYVKEIALIQAEICVV